MYRKFFKRLFDIILSIIAIIISSPFLIIISILVLIFMGWPILFKQPRPGKNEKIFNMYKFRTMTNKKDKDGNLLPDSERLNKFGRFLRKTSLDELPEFFCVLFGKMSFIGPRPLLVSYLPYYTEEEHHRHDVRPGLTGLAQVNGRNLLNWDDRFKKDLEYVNNITFICDLKIAFKTIKKVLFKDDIVVGKDVKFDRFDHIRANKEEFSNNNFIYKWIDSKELKKNENMIIKMYKDCFINYHYPNLKIDNEYFRSKIIDLENYLDDNQADVLFIYDDKKLIGFWWFYAADFINKKRYHINCAYIDSNYRSHGISKIVYKMINEKAKELNCDEIATMYAEFNEQMGNVLSKNGYEITRIECVKKIS